MLHLQQKDCTLELISRSIEHDGTGDLQSLTDEYKWLGDEIANLCESMLKAHPHAGNWFATGARNIWHFVSLWRQQLQDLLALELEVPMIGALPVFQVNIVKAALQHLKSVASELSNACGELQSSPRLWFNKARQRSFLANPLWQRPSVKRIMVA